MGLSYATFQLPGWQQLAISGDHQRARICEPK